MYLDAISYLKNNQNLIRPELDKELYAYIGAVIKLSKSIPVILNGVENHIHVLCIMSKNISLSDLMEDIKWNSSRWIKTKGDHSEYFSWQSGIGGFSVAPLKLKGLKNTLKIRKIIIENIPFTMNI